MPKITFEPTGMSYDVAAGTSYLEFCQDNEVPHDFGCTVGSCGTCRCVVAAAPGAVNEISDDERDTVEMATDFDGARLGCQLVIKGDVSIRPVD
ncbi:2Fe-2S iron-sulfur cluster-binding protein [Engelhardtia mirabilis]|uniref:Ferredoxin--NAD(P)(+) reductase (Naphthalene dioxygenase/salicylate 5-hydroxylase ferredoxin-specific) n=1 Tax=Engelhardtia mirabilis TaxID=2528011 RepID=A0A518BII4_9BACT|nr:Ferredoxin--NAD(P)(+) reductase (naphthalene dioxygenase/salicylate 5-hydroxylase ferredoxin-specific) [Planctomycetes bacterium Pla133]QDV01102.1 Ferredoxin--NAD(P)(+) reductase (naphthalene dioxygenase/salicylate 5-hydroxylase ferredoxin-specific) [Planctomycetes bacterium Pla86]